MRSEFRYIQQTSKQHPFDPNNMSKTLSEFYNLVHVSPVDVLCVLSKK